MSIVSKTVNGGCWVVLTFIFLLTLLFLFIAYLVKVGLTPV